MALYRVLSGATNIDGRTYSKDETVETHLPLDKMFVNAFERVDAGQAPAPVQSPAPAPMTTPAPARRARANPSATSATSATRPKGKDVTADFPLAVEQDFLVFKTGRELFVYDSDDLTRPLNEKGITKQSEVAKFIRQALTE